MPLWFSLRRGCGEDECAARLSGEMTMEERLGAVLLCASLEFISGAGQDLGGNICFQGDKDILDITL